MAEVGTTTRSITGDITTGGPLVIIPLVGGGAAPALSVAVPLGTTTFISDIIYGANFSATFRIEEDRGAGFFVIASYDAVPAGLINSFIQTYNVGLVMTGGVGVAFRVRVATGGPTPVIITLRTYNQP